MAKVEEIHIISHAGTLLTATENGLFSWIWIGSGSGAGNVNTRGIKTGPARACEIGKVWTGSSSIIVRPLQGGVRVWVVGTGSVVCGWIRAF